MNNRVRESAVQDSWTSIPIPSASSTMDAYLVVPAAPSRGDIVLLQEIFGVNEAMRDMARAFATEGYTVLAPDLFWRLEPRVDLGYGEDDRKRGFALMQKYDQADGADDIRIAANDFDGPNGLAFSPDERLLYIAETGDQTAPSPRQYIRVFNVGTDGATLSGGDIFHKIEPGYCDGMRVDEDGNIWSSAADGVHCIDPSGELLGKILVPYRVANITFGGLAKNRLFIGASATLYSIFLNCRGVQVP